jgi:hypothetical protein
LDVRSITSEENGENCTTSSFEISNIVRTLKEKGIGWAGYSAFIKVMKNAFRILIGKPQVRCHVGG